MAYNKKKIFNQAKEVIQKNKLFFTEDIVAFLPCSRSTFYDFFPDKSDELDTLKELLEQNRIEIKVSMRSKWYKSENATLQLALMKLIGTDEEAHRLNGSSQKIDATTNGKDINTIINLGSGIKPEGNEGL
jgi:glycerophosphoryl diester phosphodiesterase